MHTTYGKIRAIISLDESLLHEIEQAATDLAISQDRLWEMAIEEFIRRRQKRPSIEAIHTAYAVPLDEEEQQTLNAIAKLMHPLAEPWE